MRSVFQPRDGRQPSLVWAHQMAKMRSLLGLSLLAGIFQLVAADVCHSRHFRELRGYEDDDYILYGITQDCQVFIIRPPQLALLSTLAINIHNTYCNPNLVQLIQQSHDTILLLIKQAGNRICSLEIQIPPAEMLFGDHLFSYSLLGSLSYAACSHVENGEFELFPDLSFPDSVYKNVIYFIDGKSSGAVWNSLQFLVTPEGHLQYMDKIAINNYAKNDWNGVDMANEYVIGIDAQKNYLFQRNRFEQSYVYTCAYDLMFRPNKVAVHYANSTAKTYRTWLNSMSADGSLLLFTETDRTVQPPVTRIYGQNITTGQHYCLAVINFALEMGVIRQSTIRKIKMEPLPLLGETTRKMGTTTIGYASIGRGATTRRIDRPRKTSLKQTTVIYSTTQRMVTGTRYETSTESYDEDDAYYVTTPDVNPVTLSTDSNEIGLMTSSKEDRSLKNSTLDALNQNQTSSTNNLVTITVSALVLYRLL